MDCGNKNVILGLPWLRNANPTINWDRQTLTILESVDQSADLYHLHIADLERHNTHFPKVTPRDPPMTKPLRHVKVHPIHDRKLYRFLGFETEPKFLNRATVNGVLCQVMRCGSHFIPKGSLLVARLNTATNLAIETEKSKPKATLPPEYPAFLSVFSEEASSCLPPSCPYDHAINLDNTFVPKIGKVYPLSHDKQKATEGFLEENLHSGKIQPSKSPQASLFFFVKKKDSKLRPCQDYRYLNSHTTRDAYPLPLVLTSLTNSRELRSSPNLTFNVAITTSTSRTEINGRAPSSPIKASSKLWSCSLA
jgi:hypothetical protein